MYVNIQHAKNESINASICDKFNEDIEFPTKAAIEGWYGEKIEEDPEELREGQIQAIRTAKEQCYDWSNT